MARSTPRAINASVSSNTTPVDTITELLASEVAVRMVSSLELRLRSRERACVNRRRGNSDGATLSKLACSMRRRSSKSCSDPPSKCSITKHTDWVSGSKYAWWSHTMYGHAPSAMALSSSVMSGTLCSLLARSRLSAISMVTGARLSTTSRLMRSLLLRDDSVLLSRRTADDGVSALTMPRGLPATLPLPLSLPEWPPLGLSPASKPGCSFSSARLCSGIEIFPTKKLLRRRWPNRPSLW
mmetsp:Transcript_21601/g.68947  ORF Transcript_21601/g.68947 Transcript_21601/m.68947 type:complete len:240 (+) Transcript_21601:92-811(+)